MMGTHCLHCQSQRRADGSQAQVDTRLASSHCNKPIRLGFTHLTGALAFGFGVNGTLSECKVFSCDNFTRYYLCVFQSGAWRLCGKSVVQFVQDGLSLTVKSSVKILRRTITSTVLYIFIQVVLALCDSRLERHFRRSHADHERGDGGPHHDRMEQGRSRRARHSQGRRARARHAHGVEQGFRAARQALRRGADARDRSTRRGLRIRDDPARRHDRRVPDREPRADVDAAAPEAGEVLRSRDRSRDRAPRSDPGRHGASLSPPPPGRGGRRLSLAPNWRRCSARRSACRCSRNRR